MEPLEVAANHFRLIGMRLTEKSCRSLATAIGLAGSFSGCDESLISIGLRRSNSVLAHLTDHLGLNFERPDEENAEHAEYRVDEIIRDELRRQGFNEQDLRIDDDPYQLLRVNNSTANLDFDQYDEKHVFAGIEGEPDTSTHVWLNDYSTPEIITLATRAARADHRKTIETFDFVPPLSDLPFTSHVFQKSSVTREMLQTEISRFRSLEPFSEQQQFVLMFSEGRLRLKTFGLLDGLKYEERTVPSQDLIVQISADTPFVCKTAIDAFEELINWQRVSERDIHRFLEEHPYFLQGDDYCSLHSELILDRGDAGPLIPDFFAEMASRNYVDIIDLKKPNEQLIVGSKNRRGFSAAVNSAVYQLREYREYFNSPKRRQEFHSRYGLKAWFPKIAVVIGRSPIGPQYEELLRARRSVLDAEIVTYDDLLERARRRCITIGT